MIGQKFSFNIRTRERSGRTPWTSWIRFSVSELWCFWNSLQILLSISSYSLNLVLFGTSLHILRKTYDFLWHLIHVFGLRGWLIFVHDPKFVASSWIRFTRFTRINSAWSNSFDMGNPVGRSSLRFRSLRIKRCHIAMSRINTVQLGDLYQSLNSSFTIVANAHVAIDHLHSRTNHLLMLAKRSVLELTISGHATKCCCWWSPLA